LQQPVTSHILSQHTNHNGVNTVQYAIIADAETTGLVEPQTIQLATKGPIAFGHHLDDFPATVVTRYKPTKPIEPGAMATHRIIPADLEGCEPSPTAFVFPPEAEYLVGFGVDYDWKAMGSPDLKRIDVLAMAKRVWDGLGSYKLTALIFEHFEAATALELTEHAHDAEQDVYLTALILEHVLAEMKGLKGIHPTSWADVYAFSEEARIPLRIGFSKYGPKNGQPGTPYIDVPTGMLKWIIDPQRVKDFDEWEVMATRRELSRRGAL
jgi:exodeoxyribonuclease X